MYFTIGYNCKKGRGGGGRETDFAELKSVLIVNVIYMHW